MMTNQVGHLVIIIQSINKMVVLKREPASAHAQHTSAKEGRAGISRPPSLRSSHFD